MILDNNYYTFDVFKVIECDEFIQSDEVITIKDLKQLLKKKGYLYFDTWILPKLDKDALIWYTKYALSGTRKDFTTLGIHSGRLGSIGALQLLEDSEEYYNKNYMAIEASRYNNMNILNYWAISEKSRDHPNHFYEVILRYIVESGNINTLKWWVNYNPKLMMSKEHINIAAHNDNINILDWWASHTKETGKKFNISRYAMDYTSRKGHINVLEWFVAFAKENGTEPTYTKRSMDNASDNGHIDVLNWWVASGLPLKWTAKSMDKASQNGHINILNWWVALSKETGIELKWSERAMDYTSWNGKLQSLDWWKSSGLEMKYTPTSIECDDIDILNWWIKSGLPLIVRKNCITNTMIKLLDDYKSSGVELNISEDVDFIYGEPDPAEHESLEHEFHYYTNEDFSSNEDN